MLYGATTVSVGSESFGVVAFEPVEGDLLPEVLEAAAEGADEIALGARPADSFGVGVGDELEVAFGDDEMAFQSSGSPSSGASRSPTSPARTGW